VNLGRTALHLAAYGGHGTCCELLVYRGANPALRDNKNSAPILLAGNIFTCSVTAVTVLGLFLVEFIV